MKKLLTILMCILIASCKNDEASLEAEVIPQPEQTLSAEIQNAHLLPDQSSIAFDFVITNNSSKPVSIAERWNSWGAQQWTILLTNSDGSKFNFTNPQEVWYKNFLSIVTIEPKKELRSSCILTLIEPHYECPSYRSSVEMFAAIRLPRKAYFSFPLQLVGGFAAKDLQRRGDGVSGDAMTNWTGSIKTRAITIKK